MIHSADHGHRKTPRISCRNVRGARCGGGSSPLRYGSTQFGVGVEQMPVRGCTQQILGVDSVPLICRRLSPDFTTPPISHSTFGNGSAWLLWLTLKADSSSTSFLLSFLMTACATRPSPPMCPCRPSLLFFCLSSALLCPPHCPIQTNNAKHHAPRQSFSLITSVQAVVTPLPSSLECNHN